MQNDLTLRQAQADTDAWIRTVGVRYFNELTNVAILAEEVGEVARLAAVRYGEKSPKPEQTPERLAEDWADELGDVLFVLMCLANQTNVDLSSALARGLEKRNRRDADRHRRNPKLHPTDTSANA